MAQKLEFSQVQKVFEERGFVLLEDSYVNSETPLRYRCECGNESQMSYKNVKKGRSCSECGKKKLSKAKTKFTIEYIRDYFQEHDCDLLSNEYKPSRDKTKDKLEYVCSCGSHAEISWYQAFHSGTNCGNCRSLRIGDIKRKYSLDDVRELFAEQGKLLLETEFKNSLSPMRYICKCGNESHTNLNNFFKGKDCYQCRNEKISELMKDPEITDEERALRRTLRENKSWRLEVYERDNYTCQCCGKRGTKLNAHHVFNFADNPDVRTSADNGVTLCINCHKDFHKQYGVRNTDDKQLSEFLSSRGGE
jgi:5-methylcytosine-specific restriction endonuclease McrA